ncbi:sugar nucleotide-binding protein [Pectinatus brassicae]|uniref:RmlD-like substrate binding domain-containing protein n=1 Tax=Pectinatus brassicae TaxID=862415 RepID=A0A840UVG3_9FIRM|nr:sugar nucleotide-binding protein [Pectinatus brassicae]MBB5336814.1 hypothetical protein [Pectinatus brassicae]
MNILVGYTGFVGSNINASFKFDNVYNSKNIVNAYNTKPNILVYAGVPATKFLANNDENADLLVIKNAIENIKQINPQKMILISTIDVFKNPVNVDEMNEIDTVNLCPYGKNRYYLEQWVQNNINDYLIVRLPALYGENIKKNFIFDMINIVPSMLNKEKYQELAAKSQIVKKSYELQKNGFYKFMGYIDKGTLKEEFLRIGFSALNFTDSRSTYQFYNLKYLWKDINIALKNKLKILHLAVEPVKASEIYRYVYGKNFLNEFLEEPVVYDYRTKYSELFGGKDGYIYKKKTVLDDIKNFIEAYKL